MPEVRFRFRAVGEADVRRAFRSITAEAQKAKVANDRAVVGARQAAVATAAARRSVGSEAEREARRAREREVREAESAARRKALAEKRARDHVARIRDRHFREEQRQMDKVAAARIRSRERGMSGRLRELGSAAIGMGGVGIAAGAALAGVAARDALELRDISTRIAVQSRRAGERGLDPMALAKQFRAASLATPGIGAADIAEGVSGFVTKTGRLDVAMPLMETFATAASGTGADVRDIANAAADLFQKFDVTSVSEMQDALAALTMQGKEGAFELKDAAEQYAEMASVAARFGLDKGLAGVKTLGGMTQLARSAAGSAPEAATAVEAMFRALVDKSDLIEAKTGAKVFTGADKRQTRDFRQVLTETIVGAKGNQALLGSIFDIRGIKAVTPLVTAYNRAFLDAVGDEATKSAAALAALNKALDGAINAPGAWDEVQRDAGIMQTTTTAKVNAAWERVVSLAEGHIVPNLDKWVDALDAAVPLLDPLFGAFGELAKLATSAADALGLIKKREPPGLHERIKEKKKELALTNERVDRAKERGDRKTFVTESRKKEVLDAELAVLETELYRPANEVFTNFRSPAEFMEAYRKLGPARMTVGEMFSGAPVRRESKEQQELRKRWEEQQRLDKQGIGGVGQRLDETTARVFTMFADSVTNAAKRLDALAFNQPSGTPVAP